VPETWGVETGELTPTMKLKRRVILERYQKTIDDLYKGEE
jgi:long-chain acyl-CoA synthetase